MKNFVIATVSAIALLSVAAQAQEKPTAKKAEIPAQLRKAEKPAQIDGKNTCPKVSKKGKKHHGAHGRTKQGRALAVYINYPPVDPAAFCACPCEYYQGNQTFAYMYHEGYYWYPHAQAGMLEGYTPQQVRGSYWYPSRLHPHAVYIDRKDMLPHEIYPVQIGKVDKKKIVKKKNPSKKASKKHVGKPAAIPTEKAKPAPKGKM